MQPEELKRIREILKIASELKQFRETLKKIQGIKEQQDKVREFFKAHPMFSSLSAEDLAFVREKADYDEVSWNEIVKALQ